MEWIFAISVGLGLSAACGFRVFVPPFVAGLASRLGHLELAENFVWMSGDVILIVLGAAILIEALAFCLPLVSHFLDAIAIPVAVIAGTLLTASMVSDMSPWLHWSCAVIGGGGVAGVVKANMTVIRGAAGMVAPGIGTMAVSIKELGASVIVAILSVALPLFAIFAAGFGLIGTGYLGWRFFKRTSTPL